MVDNCQKQNVELTGYELIDLITSLRIWHDSISNEETKKSINQLKNKLKSYYDKPEKRMVDLHVGQQFIQLRTLTPLPTKLPRIITIKSITKDSIVFSIDGTIVGEICISKNNFEKYLNLGWFDIENVR